MNMASEKLIKVFERIIKRKKGKPTTNSKEIKTDGIVSGSEKAIAALQKYEVTYFEVVDQNKSTKTVYSRTLSGKNYETKVVKS
jgi:hypothetical protein